MTPMRSVPDHIQKPDYAEKGIPVSERDAKKAGQIVVHSEEQIEGMRKVCRLAREVLEIAGKAVKAGVTTEEIDLIVHQACIERDSYPSPLNYYNFPKSCCTSVNEVICHGIPDMRPLKNGDICNIDITLYHGGFHGDLNATYPVGSISKEAQLLIDVARECLDEAIKICRPGTLYRELGNVIQKIANKHKVQITKSYCGHGINELFHCTPTVPHYGRNKAIGVMKEGHIFTIEPMINLGTGRDRKSVV